MQPRREGDLKVMSFGEHLEELRARIVRSLLVALLFTVIALAFQGPLMRFLSGPHQRAMAQVQGRRLAAEVSERLGALRARLVQVPLREGGAAIAAEERFAAALARLEADAPERGKEEPFARDVLELFAAERRGSVTGTGVADRLDRIGADLAAAAERHAWGAEGSIDEAERHRAGIEAAIALWRAHAADPGEGEPPAAVTARGILRELDVELAAVGGSTARLRHYDREKTPLRLLGYTEAFISHLKVAFLCGLLLGLPWITFELWQFIAAGLYRHERTAVGPFLPASIAGLVLGGAFAYWVLIPIGLTYLGSYGDPELLLPEFTLTRYLSLVFSLLIGMGLVFQLPLVMVFLARTGIVSPEQYRSHRKFSIMGAVVLGAVLTPPDVVSQLLTAIPLIVLYELGIVGSIWFRRRAAAAAKGVAP